MIIRHTEGYVLDPIDLSDFILTGSLAQVNIERLPTYSPTFLQHHCQTEESLSNTLSIVESEVDEDYYSNLLLACFFHSFDLDMILTDIKYMADSLSSIIQEDLIFSWSSAIRYHLEKYHILVKGILNFSAHDHEDFIRDVDYFGLEPGYYALHEFKLFPNQDHMSAVLQIIRGGS